MPQALRCPQAVPRHGRPPLRFSNKRSELTEHRSVGPRPGTPPTSAGERRFGTIAQGLNVSRGVKRVVAPVVAFEAAGHPIEGIQGRIGRDGMHSSHRVRYLKRVLVAAIGAASGMALQPALAQAAISVPTPVPVSVPAVPAPVPVPPVAKPNVPSAVPPPVRQALPQPVTQVVPP